MTIKYKERLIQTGMILFLLGLLVGFALPAFHNPRLGLSAHLEGVMNGMFLILVGLIWQQMNISARSRSVLFWLLIWGSYANYLACVLGAATGASRATPIAGAGFAAGKIEEAIVAGLFVSVGITMFIAVTMMVIGLRPLRPDQR